MADFKMNAPNDAEKGFNESLDIAKRVVNTPKNIKNTAKAVKNAPKNIKNAVKGTKSVAKAALELSKILLKFSKSAIIKILLVGGAPVLTILLVICILIFGIFSVFMNTGSMEEMPTVYDTIRSSYYSILTGEYEGERGDVISSGQSIWQNAYQSAIDKAQQILDDTYNDYDNSNVSINTYPKSIDSIVDTVVVYFMAVNTTVFHHTESSDEELEKTLEEKMIEDVAYFSSQVNSNIFDSFFEIGTPQMSIKLMQSKISAEDAKNDSYFMKNCDGKGYLISYSRTNPNGSSTIDTARVCSLKVEGSDKQYGLGEGELSTYNGYQIGDIQEYVVDTSKYEQGTEVNTVVKKYTKDPTDPLYDGDMSLGGDILENVAKDNSYSDIEKIDIYPSQGNATDGYTAGVIVCTDTKGNTKTILTSTGLDGTDTYEYKSNITYSNIEKGALKSDWYSTGDGFTPLAIDLYDDINITSIPYSSKSRDSLKDGAYQQYVLKKPSSNGNLLVSLSDLIWIYQHTVENETTFNIHEDMYTGEIPNAVIKNAGAGDQVESEDDDSWKEQGYYRYYDGSITIPINYNLGEYRKDEIDEIVKKEAKEKEKSEDEIRESIDQEINDIIYQNTEILKEQNAFKTDSDFDRYGIDGLQNIVSSDGWTFPTRERVGITAGTWSYPSGGEHRGIDLAVPNHTELLAVGDGVILRAADGVTSGYLGNYESAAGGTAGGGNMILLLTPINGQLYAVKYCHMTRGLLVSSGQTVKAGDVIGYSGSTGNSSGPHCHIEVMLLGDADNYASFAASWDGDWTCGTGWNLSRVCGNTSAPCKVRPEEVLGF